MPNIPRVILAPAAYRPAFSTSVVRRFALCVLLTSLNAGVIATYGATLYRATVNHPLWTCGVSLLFALMLGSLARVWILTLRGRSR
jgi:hypothetical protein